MHYIGIIGIVVLCSLAGIYAGGIGKKKILFFLEFKRVLTLLKGEIRYGMTPIGEACLHVSEKTEKELKEFLVKVGQQTKEKKEDSFEKIWKEACATTLPKGYFTQGEWKQVLTLGSAVGYLDVPMQLRAFDLLLEQMEHGLDSARKKQEKDGKLYQTLGIGVGLMLAIVLI
ncbi:MAG: stage III sporulation protein AB [Lachnospiraceae bacterium]|nr:stage III sporulation protein AB [Lachnospiraceae bacterium]